MPFLPAPLSESIPRTSPKLGAHCQCQCPNGKSDHPPTLGTAAAVRTPAVHINHNNTRYAMYRYFIRTRRDPTMLTRLTRPWPCHDANKLLESPPGPGP
jgi:hypothetical protein